jgi:alkylhydroperoxidase family enzyme
MTAAQAGHADDPKTAAALAFATRVVRQRAKVDAADVDALRHAGFDDGQIMELMAHVALNLFTNYVNVAFAVPVDFPHVRLRAK